MTKNARSPAPDLRDGGAIDLDVEDVRLADGTRLTEAKAEALAEEVLHRTRRGRPSLTAPGERSPQLRLSLPAELRRRIQAQADREHRSVSALAREALERFLAS